MTGDCLNSGTHRVLFDFKTHGEDPALVAEDLRVFSYRELSELSSAFAEMVKPRALVFMLCKNTPGMIACYAGLLNKGAVPLLLGSRIAKEALLALIKIYRPSYIVSPSEISVEGRPLLEREGVRVYETGEGNPPVLHENLALLLSTSGSTGSPKLVRISLKNLESNASSIIKSLAITKDNRAITALPMNYSYGLSVINTRLISGASLAVTSSGLMQKPFWELFDRAGVNSLSGVPYSYEMLKRLGFTRKEYPNLKVMDQAGGHLDEVLQKEFSEYCASHGIRFYLMYGQTEATARMACLPFKYAQSKPGCAGLAIDGGKFSIRDENGTVISSPSAEGRLFYEGPNVAMGYATDACDLKKGDEWRGVLDTGDRALMDEYGFIFIKGRESRFLKVYGNRLSLDDCALMAERYFKGIKAACAGRDDLVMVCIEGEADPVLVREYLSEATNLNKRAFKVAKVAALPRSSSGKILYRELEKYF